MRKRTDSRIRTAQIILILFVLSFLLSGCDLGSVLSGGIASSNAVTYSGFAMDTTLEIRAYGVDESVTDEAVLLVRTMEDRFSVTTETSDVAELNETGMTEADPMTTELVRRALELCDETGGTLDITVYPVLRAWGFTTGTYTVPSEATLRDLLKRVDHRLVAVDGDRITVPDGVMVDLGAVAKGYACDRMRDVLTEGGATSALIDFGGNICAIGTKPDGKSWRIGVRSPEGNGLAGVLDVSDECVVTSGGYERYFTADDGTVYWHILDPATGYPAKNGLISVTIVGPSGIRCDALSTALFVMGTEKAVDFWREKQDFDAILITDDGRMLLTPGVADRFTADKDCPFAVESIGGAK